MRGRMFVPQEKWSSNWKRKTRQENSFLLLKKFKKKPRRQEKRANRSPPRHFLEPLQQPMAPICPNLTFERISDYAEERGTQRWARSESSTGVCGGARMILCPYNNEKSRVKITCARRKRVRWHSRLTRILETSCPHHVLNACPPLYNDDVVMLWASQPDLIIFYTCIWTLMISVRALL